MISIRKYSALMVCTALMACGTSGTTTTGTGGTTTTTTTSTNGSVGSSVSVGASTGTTTAPDCANDPTRPGCTGTTVQPFSTSSSTGSVSSVSFNAARDEITIASALGLPFDGGGTYVRAPAFDQGRFRAFTTQNSPAGAALREYYALYGQSASGELTATAAGSSDYGNHGFRGTNYTATGTAGAPATGSARYTGDYASLLTVNGVGLLYIRSGDVVFDVDFTDRAVGGTVTNRVIPFEPRFANIINYPEIIRDAGGNIVDELLDLIVPGADPALDPLQNGTIPSLDALVEYFESNPTNPLGLPIVNVVQEDLVFPALVLSDTRDALNGTTFTGLNATSTAPPPDNPTGRPVEWETGTYQGIVGGPNLEEVVGSVTVTSTVVIQESLESEENGVFIAEGGVLMPDNTNP